MWSSYTACSPSTGINGSVCEEPLLKSVVVNERSGAHCGGCKQVSWDCQAGLALDLLRPRAESKPPTGAEAQGSKSQHLGLKPKLEQLSFAGPSVAYGFGQLPWLLYGENQLLWYSSGGVRSLLFHHSLASTLQASSVTNPALSVTMDTKTSKRKKHTSPTREVKKRDTFGGASFAFIKVYDKTPTDFLLMIGSNHE
ncbi:hypothetical protein UY3_15552 [Chelonia mydas]|uniref:Uncharacterized protein n=1 Tax=Chelonia mydas TaxID=8469 RepID=M7B5I4_CHEMY|nr:hypothetical protein UY3_15552 [Chelonia mydas]